MAQPQMPAFEAFNILGLPRDATLDELNARFKQKARQNHPDKAKDKGELAQAAANLKMAQLNNAREVLSPNVSKLPRAPKPRTAPKPKFQTAYEYDPWSEPGSKPQGPDWYRSWFEAAQERKRAWTYQTRPEHSSKPKFGRKRNPPSQFQPGRKPMPRPAPEPESFSTDTEPASDSGSDTKQQQKPKTPFYEDEFAWEDQEYRPSSAWPLPPKWPSQEPPDYFRNGEYNFTSTYYASKQGAHHYNTKATKDEEKPGRSPSDSTGKATDGSATSTQSNPSPSPPQSDQSRLTEKLQAMRQSLLAAAKQIENMRRTPLPFNPPPASTARIPYYHDNAALLSRLAEVLTHEINKIQHKIWQDACSDGCNVQYASTIWIDQVLLKRQHEFLSWVEEIGDAAGEMHAVGHNGYAARRWWMWLEGKRWEYARHLEGWEWEENGEDMDEGPRDP